MEKKDDELKRRYEESERQMEKLNERVRAELKRSYEANERKRQKFEAESERIYAPLEEAAQSAFNSIAEFNNIRKRNEELRKKQAEQRKKYDEEQVKKKEEQAKKEEEKRQKEAEKQSEMEKIEAEIRKQEEKNRELELQIRQQQQRRERKRPYEQNMPPTSLFGSKNQQTSKKVRMESDSNPNMTKPKTETRTSNTEHPQKSADEILQEREINTQVDIKSFNSLFEGLKYLYTTGNIEHFLNGVEKQLIEGAQAKITIAQNSNKGLFQKKKRQEQISHAKKEYNDLINKFFEQQTKSRINGINDILGRLQKYGISEMVSSEQKKLEKYSEQLSNKTEDVRDVESQNRLKFLKDLTDKLSTIMSKIAQDNRFMNPNTPEHLDVSLKSLTYRGLERGVDITETVDRSKLDKALDNLPSLMGKF